jgi:hypothetical protein
MSEDVSEDFGIELKAPDPNMGLASISHIKNSLDRIFGKGSWQDLEVETISITLGIELDELTRDKIHVLQIITSQPELFFDDAAFILYATDVINNIEADFDFVPTPTSLELAFAITQVRRILTEDSIYIPVENSALAAVSKYILMDEGYRAPVFPFDFITADNLGPNEYPEDTKNKEKAIRRYIREMGGE